MLRAQRPSGLHLLERDCTMYATTNFKTKKALKEAVASGEKIGIYQPGPFGGGPIADGQHCLEGPFYPAPHSWYATITLEEGIITKVK